MVIKTDAVDLIRQGDATAIRELIQAGLLSAAPDDKGRTLLHWASSHLQPVIVSDLLNTGTFDPNTVCLLYTSDAADE